MSVATTDLIDGLLGTIEIQVQRGHEEAIFTLEILEKCLASNGSVTMDAESLVRALANKVDEKWARESIGTLAGRAVLTIGNMSKLHNISWGKDYIQKLYERQDESRYTRDPFFWNSVKAAYEDIRY